MKLIIFLIFICSVEFGWQASTPSSPTYEAGVVEFFYTLNSDAIDSTNSNLIDYLRIIEDAPETLDILVFPEITLNPSHFETAVEIPDPKEKIVICESENYSEDYLLKKISCSAKNHKRYLVINLMTKVKCPDAEMIANKDPRNCTDRPDGFSYYNTNVVFDRTGALISRYRKYNLFGEKVDAPSVPELVYFDTDFGVRFGTFVCFDIAFRWPSMELLRQHKITDIVYPTHWYSELPFATAVQFQQSFAYANDVNLLASGANNISLGATGTGIYAGRKGSVISVMEAIASTKLYTATVPKKVLGDNIEIEPQSIRYPREQMEPLTLFRDRLRGYEFFMVPNAGAAETRKVCQNSFCCDFTYNYTMTSTTTDHYNYALTAFHGPKLMDGFLVPIKNTLGMIVCSVIACTTQNPESCGMKNDSLEIVHEWHKIEISATFPQGNNFFIMPNSLDASLMPFEVNEFNFESTKKSESEMSTEMKSIGNLRKFYTFGITGRDFSLDNPQYHDGSGIVKISSFLIIFLISLVFVVE